MVTIGVTVMSFVEWLEGELSKRRWTRADLAREAKLSQTSFSKIFSGERKPGPDLCNAIARALNIAPEIVFRRAGLLPALPEDDDKFLDEVVENFKRLSVKQRRAVLEYVIFQLREQDRQEQEAQEPEENGGDS
jgi:transcriptional regulator with XRE-family HTH domain